MHDTLHQNDVEHLVQERIEELYSTARELHGSRRDAMAHAGLLMRTRWTVGRRLVSIGQSVAGQGV